MVSAIYPDVVADRPDVAGAIPPPPLPTSPTSPKPPGGPPSGKRPVAHLAAAAAVESAPASAGAEMANPYGLSEEALQRKQRFDRERAHSNSAVRAVRLTPHIPILSVASRARAQWNLLTMRRILCGQEIVLGPLDAAAIAAAGRSARAARDGEVNGIGRSMSDERSNQNLAELAAKARWKQLLSGVKLGDTAVVLRLLHEARDMADAPSPTAVRSALSSRSKSSSGTVEPYGSQRRPLHYAALYKQAKVMKVLLAHGADPNATDKQGWSPLHCAALNGNIAVARILLAAGAAPQARVFIQGNSDQGESSADFARRHQQGAVADVIERHVAFTAKVLAYQRLAWVSAFHPRLGAESCIPSTLAHPPASPRRPVTPAPAPAPPIEPGTSPSAGELVALSQSVALGCLSDLAPESVVARVARPFGSLRDATGAVIWQPAPAQRLLHRYWQETHPGEQPGPQQLPWCDE